MPELSFLRQFFCTCLCLCVFFAMDTAAPTKQACAADKKTSGYRLELEGSRVGMHQVTVCTDAVRFECAGFACFSKGPLWDVYLLRTDRKQYAQLSYKAWQNANPLTSSTDRMDTVIKSITERYVEAKGNKIIVYTFPKVMANSKSMLFQTQDKEDSKLREIRTQVDCLEFPNDQHTPGVLNRFYGLPVLKGTPMNITSRGGSYATWELKTRKLAQATDISSKLFEVPAGLKKIQYSNAMFISDNTRGVIDDYFSGAK